MALPFPAQLSCGRAAAVIGVPDPLRTEVVKAFIVVRSGHEAGPGLEAEIREFVKTHLSPHEYPRKIAFVDGLPMTATGKLRRRDLRELERENNAVRGRDRG